MPPPSRRFAPRTRSSCGLVCALSQRGIPRMQPSLRVTERQRPTPRQKEESYPSTLLRNEFPTQPFGCKRKCYKLIYPLFEKGCNTLFRAVVRKDKYLRQRLSAPYLRYGIRAIHKHLHIVGQHQIATTVAADIEQLLACCSRNKESLDVGEQTSHKRPKLGTGGVDYNFSHQTKQYISPLRCAKKYAKPHRATPIGGKIRKIRIKMYINYPPYRV